MRIVTAVLGLFIIGSSFSKTDSLQSCIFVSSYTAVKESELRKEIRSFSEEAEMEETTTNLKLKKFRITQSYVTKFNEGMSIFKKDSIQIIIQTGPFDVRKHKLKFQKDGKFKWLEKIDGKEFYGADGNIPRTGIKKIFICFGKDTLKLDPKFYQDLYEPNMGTYKSEGISNIYHHAHVSRNGKRIYLQMLNGDGAGSYEVIWIIEGRKIIYRIVGHNC